MKKHTILWLFALTAVCAFTLTGCPNEPGADSFGAPTKIVATATSPNSITISWAQVSGALQYFVYRSTSTFGTYTRIGLAVPTDTGVCSYDVLGLSSGTTYYFTISAVNSSRESSQSQSVSATTVSNLPPTGVTANATSTSSITVSWYGVTGATSYNVYRSPSATGIFSQIGTATTTSYTDTTLSAGTTYYYKVAVANVFGESTQSSAVSATTIPGVPTSVSATATSSSSITISWYGVNGATNYKIYRSSSANGTYSQIATSPSSPYTNTGLSASTTYYYKVAAVNTAGESDQSSYDSATTLSSGSPGLGSENNPIPLTADAWTDGSITTTASGSAVWYSFNVSSVNTYYLWWDESGTGQGKTLDVKVSASYSTGSGTGSFTGIDGAWSTPRSFSPSSSGTVKIKVEPYSSGTGTFAIVYSTSSTRPSASPSPGPGGSTDYSGTYMGSVQQSGSLLGSSATVSSTSISVGGTDIPISIGDDNDFTFSGVSGTWAYIYSSSNKIGIVVYSSTYQLAFGSSASTINSTMSLGASTGDMSSTYSGLLTKMP